jgi:hypothetical protein
MLLQSKSQFDALSVTDKEAVLFFLEDRFTEENVSIELSQGEGKTYFRFKEATDCEVLERENNARFNRDFLRSVLKGELPEVNVGHIKSLTLCNLLQVDEQITRLAEVIPLTGLTYWLQLYRIATCSLTEQSTELELVAVRTIQALVMYVTITEFNYDDVKFAFDLLHNRVALLQSF